MVWRKVYPGRADQAVCARKFPATLLAGTGIAEDGEWIAAELVSNALRHTRSGEHGGWFGVEVTLGDRACIAVRDLGGGGVPALMPARPGGDLSEHGRGLLGVSELAVEMGVRGSAAVGHTVWAQLTVGGEPERRAS